MDKTSVMKNGVKRLRLSQYGKHYLNEETCDVRLVINGEKIPGHRIILASSSAVFDALLFGKNKDNPEKEIELKFDTSIDSFKLLLKFIYFDEFDTNDLKNYNNYIEVYKLSHFFKMNQLLEIIIDELIPLINFDNFVILSTFAISYKLNQLIDAIKNYIKSNEELMVSIIEMALNNKSIEVMINIFEILDLKQKQIIKALKNYINKTPDVNVDKYKSIIKLELCSVQDLNVLSKMRIFDNVFVERVIEKRFEDLENRCQGLFVCNERLNSEKEEKDEKYKNLSNRYVELNNKYIQLMADYKECKDLFTPFVDGMGGRVNQFVYSKTNCHLGKVTKRFQFKH